MISAGPDFSIGRLLLQGVKCLHLKVAGTPDQGPPGFGAFAARPYVAEVS